MLSAKACRTKYCLQIFMCGYVWLRTCAHFHAVCYDLARSDATDWKIQSRNRCIHCDIYCILPQFIYIFACNLMLLSKGVFFFIFNFFSNFFAYYFHFFCCCLFYAFALAAHYIRLPEYSIKIAEEKWHPYIHIKRSQ